MSLFNVCNHYTDKNTTHSYLKVYDDLFKGLDVTSLLEIGVQEGGSLLMFAMFFRRAVITGIDINFNKLQIFENDYIKLISGNAYDTSILSKLDEQYDIVIDDGSHTEEDFIRFLVLYIHKFRYLLFIEDIYDLDICFFLLTIVPNELKKCITVYDRRLIKDRYDDIMFVIDKRDVDGPKLRTYTDDEHYCEVLMEEKSVGKYPEY